MLLKKELTEREQIEKDEDKYPFLYPTLNDKQFNIKIASKKEFDDTKYDGTIHNNIKEYADKVSNQDFELQPHQQFVKNFLSSQTPYNSLLLFHGLGTGKTCSAIGVCEEMRDYMKQVSFDKKIIIVASENVQDNFRSQLFDERNLKLINGQWNIKSCTGNKLIKEINPTGIKGITRERLVQQIKNLINSYYSFLGYGQFANYIIKIVNTVGSNKISDEGLTKTVLKKLRNEFNDRLIVIDEIHNIRISDDNENKKVAMYLELLVKHAQNMRLVLLSATPMYNSYKEIIWLLNIMNTNDRRGKMKTNDIFDKNGNFKEGGKDLLIRKATGYVSFVRGENPYTFPYRIYPSQFAIKHTFPYIKYPQYQMNLKKIPDDNRNRILSLYLNTLNKCENKCGECQYCIYKYIISYLRNKEYKITFKKGERSGQEIALPSFENMENFGYSVLQNPLRSLIISYPYKEFNETIKNIENDKFLKIATEDTAESIVGSPEESSSDESSSGESSSDESSSGESSSDESSSDESSSNKKQKGGYRLDPNELTGKKGLERIMNFVDTATPSEKGKFSYKPETITNYGNFFGYKSIGKYISKIKCSLDCILNPETKHVSEGVILVYSQYLDGGLIPIALALEEMGFIRYGNNVKSLFETKPTDTVDARTLKPPTTKTDFAPARYSLITGDRRLSPDNEYEVKGLTNENNKDGNTIKVVLISRAGAEGIDFKFIRQIHVMDPWYNMNRIEQIIGRGVRNFSHKDLAFEKRNVEIFMHGTIIGKENEEEAADLYVYRFAEIKAIQIGKITRLLKEVAVDCLINHEQTNFTQDKMSEIMEGTITQTLSSGMVIHDFKVGDSAFSPACDYMSSCDYNCNPNKLITENDVNNDSYNETFIFSNNEKILQRIRMLFKEGFFYKKEVLIQSIQIQTKYPLVQIYAALTQLIEDNTEVIIDKYGRSGRLININEYYLFQPTELNNNNISIFQRSTPLDYKSDNIEFVINKDLLNRNNVDFAKKQKLDAILEREPAKEKEKDNELIVRLNSLYETSKEYSQIGKVPRGENNWYKHAGVVMNKFTQENADIKNYILSYLVAHIIEELFFWEKLELMKFLYKQENIEKDTFIWYLKIYFQDKIIVTNKFKCFIMYDLGKMKLMILNDRNDWTEAEPEDVREIARDPVASKIFSFQESEYNKYVGFLGYKKKNVALVFKTKDIESKRDTGALCEEAGKEKSITKLNLILGEDKYTLFNTKLIKDKKGTVTQEVINQTELCVLQEFWLRYFNTINKQGKKWFLTPEMAIYYKMYKVL